MEKSMLSVSAIGKFIEDTLKGYVEDKNNTMITDIHLKVKKESGELLVLNDDDIVLSEAVIENWKDEDDLYRMAESVLRDALSDLRNSSKLDALDLVKPYSFVLIDDNKETIAELLLINDEGVYFLNDGLLEGLDDELDEFLKDLLKM